MSEIPTIRGDQLVDRLQSYEPFDDAERAHVVRTLAWLRRAERPLDRREFEPGHAVGSAFLVSENGEVALVRHARLKRWLQPGGHAEEGESDLAVVAAREATEELGISVAPESLELFDVDVHEIPAKRSDPSHLHFDFRFLGEVDATPLHAATDALAAAWVGSSRAHETDVDPGLRRMFDKATQRRLLR